MTARTPLPKLDLDLDKGLPAEHRRSDRAVEENARAIAGQWGATTQLPRQKRSPSASFRIELPDYLDQELALDAVRQKVSKNYLILKGLQALGYAVKEEDLVPDRRRKQA